MTEKKILITGAGGFIGAHLLNELKKRGKQTVAYYEDVLKPISTKEDIGTVIHLAARVSREKQQIDKEVYETNFIGTINVLEFCKEKKAKLIFASSCTVYGNPQTMPVREDCPPSPLVPYATAKLAAEYACQDYARRYGVKSIILRIFNPYGKNQNPCFLVPTIIKGLQEEVQLHSPDLTRDYVHIKDIVDAFIRAIDYGGQCEIVNIGSGKPYAVKEMVAMVEKISRKTVKYSFTNQEVPVKGMWADITKAKRLLQWEPKIPLEEGLKDLLAT